MRPNSAIFFDWPHGSFGSTALRTVQKQGRQSGNGTGLAGNTVVSNQGKHPSAHCKGTPQNQTRWRTPPPVPDAQGLPTRRFLQRTFCYPAPWTWFEFEPSD
ncbi:hypothetical protein MAPG_06351 [Magnaporthiopsis poae ATCC 64411]|uniref:Uncharacterized protein n=1 Tax=Magnaporthiopsis poae (strain ATCC 64411 / 73-15) TaxID=644358 RepID=A0A0C4E1T2_MAGP6|nr:hypothetical protein MAPG_06351 [Magnaporthiopsis poae ATCC 64411]